MATWIDKLGDEAKSDWGKAKGAVQQVRNYFVDKVTSLKPKLGISVGVDIDAAIRIILDDSFLKVIDRIAFALDNAIDKVGAEFQQLVKQLFSELSALADKIDQTIDKVFKNISTALADIKKNLIDPIVTAIADLETKLIKDINQVLDKVFDFFQGTAQDFKDDISKGTSAASQLDFRVDGSEFAPGIIHLHLPYAFGGAKPYHPLLKMVDIRCPSSRFLTQRFDISKASTTDTLTSKRTEFILGNVQPFLNAQRAILPCLGVWQNAIRRTS